MQFPYPVAMTLPRGPDAEGSGGNRTYPDSAGTDDGDGGGHYNPDQPRDWHGRWTAGPDERGGNHNLLEVADSSGASASQPMIWLEASGQPNLLDQATVPPAWKADVFAGQPGAWQSFNRAVAGLPEAGGTEAFSYGEIFAASALADTLFRFGPSGGTKLIQQALDRVMPGAVGIDGRMGPGTFGVYREFATNPATRGRLLDELYGARAKFLKGREEDRNQHFRYLRQR